MTALVSCIMPTWDRRPFVGRAVDYFLTQDYPERELVVVDDGRDAVEDLMPDDPRVRYLRLEGKRTLGAKRNFACRQARGSIVVHWDDDDWMATWRLSYQVERLLASGASLCGLDRLLFYDPAADAAWRYVYPKGLRPWLAGGTFCYLKSFWEAHPFADINVGEDNRFVRAARPDQIERLEDDGFYLALVHPGNTSPKRTRGRRWRPVEAAEARRRLGGDLDFYARLGGRRLEPEPAPRPRPVAVPTEASSAGEVSVAIPFHGCRRTLRRAVESVLAQTHADLTLVVVNDGDRPPWDLLGDLDDPRLVRFDLEANRGRYFADAVVLAASRAPFFLVQDADDWSEPERVERLLRLLRAEHAAGVVSAELRHPAGKGRRATVERYPELARPLSAKFGHRANHHGLFRADALRAVGGTFGGFSIGYDTLLVNLLLMTGRIAFLDEPLYHRQLRRDSLTAASRTGMRSAARRRATERLRALYAEAYGHYRRYLAGRLGHRQLAARLRQLAGRHVTAADHEALRVEAERLRRRLTERPGRKRKAVAAEVRAGDPIDLDRLPWTEWSIDADLARYLRRHLEETRPRRLLEAGSGISTVLLAEYAARHGAELVSLEHSQSYLERTRRLLERFGLARRVDLRLAPLEPRRSADGGSWPWYRTEVDGRFDFVLVDGPPERHGRRAALFALAPLLAERWTLWLHDGGRRHEQQCVERWRSYFEFDCELTRPDAKGLYELSGRALEAPRRSGPSLAVSLLTGDRPDLLQRTLAAIARHRPRLLEESYVLGLVNGPDAESRRLLEGHPAIDRVLVHEGPVLPEGVATSRLVRDLLEEAGCELILHLEDDWELAVSGGDWLSRARRILAEEPRVGQVRLRHFGEQVLRRHMVNGRRIRWRRREGFLVAASAHYTFNPSLIRTREAARIFPCRDERGAQVNFLRSGLWTAQLVPGAFRHIGHNRSRRAALA